MKIQSARSFLFTLVKPKQIIQLESRELHVKEHRKRITSVLNVLKKQSDFCQFRILGECRVPLCVIHLPSAFPPTSYNA